VNTWTASPEHPGYRTKTLKRGNCTIVVHRPELTDKERAKRERIVESALSSYGKTEAIHRKETKA